LARRPKVQNLNDYCKKEVGLLSSFLALGMVKAITYLIKKLALLRYELNYKFHLRVRTFHDVMVVRSPGYKKVSESRYARPVKNATVSAFFVSLMLFTAVQYVIPYFNLFSPQKVQASSNSVTWSSQADFENNNVVGPDLTKGTADDLTNGPTTTRPNVYTGDGSNAQLTSSSNLVRKYTGASSGTYSKSSFSVIDSQTYFLKAGMPNYTSYKTINGGTSWTALTSIPTTNNANVYDMQFVNSSNGWAVGRTYVTATTKYYRTVWKTIDGGVTWNISYNSPYSYSNISFIGGLYFADINNGYVVGDSALWKTTDGGVTWAQTLALPSGLTDFSYVSASVGYILSGTNLYYTANGGTNWTTLPSPTPGTPTSLSAAAGRVWVGFSDGTAKYTDNNGTAWNLVNNIGTTSIKAIEFKDINIGWASSSITSALYKTVNGGSTWSLSGNIARNQTLGIKVIPGGNTCISINNYGDLTREYVGYNNGTISGLKLQAAGGTAKWGNISWNATTPGVSTVSFRTRGATTDSGLAAATWSSYYVTSGSQISPANSAWLEVEVTLNSGVDLADNPILNDFTVSYDSLEAPINANTTLHKVDGSTILKSSTGVAITAGLAGGYTNEASTKITSTGLSCTSCGTFTNPYIEVEAKLVGTAFDGTTGINVGAVDGGNASTALLTNLSNNTLGYHLQMRTKDAQGRVSTWTPYGNNAENIADITLDQANPTGTVSINTAAQYATSTTVTLTNTTSDTGGSGLSQMQFSNDGTTWSGWESYNATKSWTLSAGDGTKTVYAQFKDNAGNTTGQLQDNTQANFNVGLTKTNVLVFPNGGVALGSATTTDTFQPGPEGVDTSYSDYDTTSMPNNVSILAGNDYEGYAAKGYVRFEGPSAYAKSLTITSAMLYLTIDAQGVAGSTFSLYPAASYWGEESSASSLNGVALGTKIGNYTGASAGSGINVTTAVQSMITNNNYGFELSPDSSGPAYDNVVTFASSDGPTPSMRPKLVVTYAPLSGPPYYTSGTFESRILDSTLADPIYGKFQPSQILPGTTGISYKVRGGDNAALSDAAAWASAPIINPGDNIPAGLQGKQYLQYQASFTTSDNTKSPILDDVFVDVQNKVSDSIIVDTAIPSGTVAVRSTDPLYATNKNVVLNLEPADGGPSGLKDFALSNDGITWSAWTNWNESYRAAGAGFAWALADGADGTRNVYVKYRDNAGNNGGVTSPEGTWYPGLAGSPLEGKYVFNRDIISTDKYTTNVSVGSGGLAYISGPSNCVGPQCSTGIETYPGYTSNLSTVADNTIDFISGYFSPAKFPARDACKVLKGRLPTIAELKNIDSNMSIYGNNFQVGSYWSATQQNNSNAYAVYLSVGNINAIDRNQLSKVRCVGDPILSIKTTITLDTATPTTTIVTNPTPPSGDNSWFKGSKPSATLSGSDLGSKIAKISYRFDTDSAPYTDVVNTNTDEPFVATLDQSKFSEGVHTLYYFATDKSGQTEAHKSQQFKIDIQTPTTSYDISPGSPTGLNGWYVITAPNITLTGTDPNGGSNSGVANIYYQWTNVGGTPDAGSYISYSAPIPAAQGDKILHYYTKDMAGNVSAVETQHIKFNAYVPDVPTGFRAPKTEATLSSIVLHWDAVTNDPTGITTYNIQRRKRTPSLGSWTTITTGTCSSLPGDAVDCTDNSGLEAGFQYGYKIQAVDNAGNAGNWSDEIYGYTTDTVSPSAPNTVLATPCDGTVATCPSGNVKGFSVKVSWAPSVDLGVGLSRYVLYRKMAPTDYLSEDGWEIVGVVDGTSAPSNPVFYDNDTSNDAFDGISKTEASARLNDSTSYYYRVTALDISQTGNPSLLVDGNDMFGNLTALPGTTPDVTAPTVPQNLVASAMGIDANPASVLPGDPVTNPQDPILHQRIRLTWSASADIKARSTDLTTNSITYHIYKLNSANSTYEEIATTTNLTYNVDSLQDFTDYSFKISAEDSSASHNNSSQSASATKKTASSAVPTVPTEVTVTSTKGDPSTNTAVGHENIVTFFGSYAKNCDPIPNVRCLVRYEVFRSNTNYLDDEDWLILGNADKIADITPRVKGNDRKINENDTPYSVTDGGLDDATIYYYKVRALDNTPLVPDGGPYYSPMTAVSVGTLHQGWDITPDDTKPVIPAGGLEVKVRDTHPSTTELRNLITWKMLTDTELPTRAGISDFARYEVHREVVDANGQPISDTNVGNVSSLGDNYLVDIMSNIPELSALTYRYYVVVVDNAGTDFKYANGTVINAFSNVSAPEYWSDSIIPSKVKPVLTQPVTLTNVGVSSATVNWQTDQEADSLVQFRKKGSDDNFVAIGQVERSFNHVVNLFGLKPTTEYEYQLVSRNYLGNNVEYNATSLPKLLTTGFSITPGNVVSTTSTTEISWTTNLDASSAFVEYQLQRQPGDEAQGGTAGVEPAALEASPTSHNVVVKGLRSARTYTYKIKSISSDGYLSEYPAGEFATFKTKAFDSAQFTLAPASSNVAERNITATTAQIVWQTESPTTSWVDYSTTSGVYDGAAGNNDLVGTHVVVIDGLIPGTKYYYRVRVKDANEVEYTSQEYSFTAVLKPKISNMTVKNITPYSVTIAWDTNVDTETIVNWGKTAAYGEKRGKSGVSKVHEIVIDKLDDNQEYHYQILATDDAGNEVADTDKIVRTPLDTEGPKITGVKIDVLPMGESDTTSSIIVSWQTNKPASTLVEYGEGVIGGTYDKRSVEDTTLNNSHTVIIKGLTPASSYHYRLVSADKRSNKTISQDYTFVTPSKEKSILQLIIKSLEETFAWTRNLNQFFGNIGRRLTGR